jgi:hypothetical protein
MMYRVIKTKFFSFSVDQFSRIQETKGKISLIFLPQKIVSTLREDLVVPTKDSSAVKFYKIGNRAGQYVTLAITDSTSKQGVPV